MNDKAIIELFEQRSEKAVMELAKKYGSLCISIAKNILGDTEYAEECVNDTYLGVWNSIPPNQPESLSGYLCKVLRNVCIKRYHKNTALKRNSYYDTALDELEECLASSESVESSISSQELAALLDDFLKTLSKEDRIIFMRRYWYSDPPSVISKMTGRSTNSITVKLFRIRERLRKYLIKEGITI